MSIVNKIRELYENDPERKPSTGLPTGSRLGTCAAQLQMLRWKDRYHAELPRARMLMTWHRGRRVEAWLGEKMREVWQGAVGLEQTPFYFLVEVEDGGAMDRLLKDLQSRRLWGTVREGFEPPRMTLGDDGRVKLRLAANPKMGFVLDRKAGGVWVPTYVDFVLLHPDFGLSVPEVKSMSNYAFRRAVLGDLDYGKRCQMAGLWRATGASVILVAERAETQHLAEIAYTGTADRVKVILTKQNGSQETYWTTPERDGLALEDGTPREFPPDVEWETAQTWTPLDKGIWDEIRQRVLRVLLFDGEPGSLHREYGPSFSCSLCGGTGTQTMRVDGKTPLKIPKPCERCATGTLEETEVGFPCSYCPLVQTCYPFTRLEVDDRPHFKISRADWEASGLSFTPPEGK